MRGAWIEMLVFDVTVNSMTGRAPCGARGLKSPWTAAGEAASTSRPMRGAWIEIRWNLAS